MSPSVALTIDGKVAIQYSERLSFLLFFILLHSQLVYNSGRDGKSVAFQILLNCNFQHSSFPLLARAAGLVIQQQQVICRIVFHSLILDTIGLDFQGIFCFLQIPL